MRLLAWSNCPLPENAFHVIHATQMAIAPLLVSQANPEPIPVFSKGACLVGADGSGTAHGLTCRQHPHKVVVLHHLLHAVGQRDGDGQGETLWHRHHHNGHREDEELQRAGDQ